MKREIERILQNGITVGDLIAELRQYDEDALVVFSCDYGDYHHTQQALPVTEIEEISGNRIVESGYSRSRLAVTEDDEEQGSYCEACEEEYDGIATCPKCGAACVGEDGEPLSDDDEDEIKVIVLR